MILLQNRLIGNLIERVINTNHRVDSEPTARCNSEKIITERKFLLFKE